MNTTFLELEKDLFDFIDTSLYILLRCQGKNTINYGQDAHETEYAKNLKNNFSSLNKNRGYGLKYPHHTGIINTILINNREHRQTKPTNEDFINFEKDNLHGVFHGLMTSFVSFILFKENNLQLTNIQQNEYYINYFLSCVLHDFAKKYPNHDSYVRYYFPHLVEETYSHSTPDDKTLHSNLIISDRWELLRFPDWGQWVDMEKVLLKNNQRLNNKLLFFYKNIRPLINQLINICDKPLISHGTEIGNNISKCKFKKFPEIHWGNFDDVNVFSGFDTYFEDMPNGWESSKIIGVRPIMNMPNTTKNFPIFRDHILVTNNNDDDIKNWLFFNKRNILKNEKQSNIEVSFNNNEIFTLNSPLMIKFLQLRRMIYSRIMVHSI
jgi:hypothetical protein